MKRQIIISTTDVEKYLKTATLVGSQPIVISTSIGNIAPLMVLFPTSVITKTVLCEVLYAYGYSKDERNGFFNNEWLIKHNISEKQAKLWKSYMVPRRFVGEHFDHVGLNIDPIKVFHDMLVSQNNISDCYVIIKYCQKVQSGEFLYYIEYLCRN
jgi:hypothetical protein